MWKKFLASFAAMSLTFMACLAWPRAQLAEPGEQGSGSGEPAPKQEAAKKIVINVASRSLALYKGGEKVRLYPTGLGKTTTPTPVGYYSIRTKDLNPDWTDPRTGHTIPTGEDNPLGYRWMEFYGHYGIHGTNRPDSIGYYVSNGCVRLREKDAEELFSLVDIGTPVEITYNRVVVEKTADNTVVYYIYPDGYNRQPLNTADVSKWLEGYGVAAFETDDAIAQKIAASDGQPTYIAKVYPLAINGQKLAGKAVVQDDITYLPAALIATNLKMSLKWRPESAVLITPYGQATGYNKKGTIYFSSEDTPVLFHADGGLTKQATYAIETAAATGQAGAPTKPAKDAASAQPKPDGVTAQPAASTPMAEPAKPNKPAEPAQTKPAAAAKPEGAGDKAATSASEPASPAMDSASGQEGERLASGQSAEAQAAIEEEAPPVRKTHIAQRQTEVF